MKLNLSLCASVAAITLALPSGALAQDAESPEDGAAETKRLERITVTSRKVEESLADAPISVLAVDGDALSAANITEIEDLALVAPGVTFNESANSRGRGPRIRGVGTNLFGDGVEGSVATYVDGVVLGRQAMGINDLIDIERVEVLRGPQGTLFGKNASAGLINIVTKNPNLDEFSLDASVSYANQSEDDADETKFAASVSAPIVEDQLGFRLTGYSNDRDGYLTNVNTGNEFNDKSEYGVRGKLLWSPTSTLDVLLAGDYSHRDQNCCITSALAYGATRSTTPEFAAITPGPRNTNVFIDREEEYFQDQEQYGFSGEVNWDLGFGTLTSITALRKTNIDDNNESENNPPGIGNDLLLNDVQQDQEQFTQEVRLAGETDRFKYVVGAFYFDQSIEADTTLLVTLRPGPPVPGGNDVSRFVDTQSVALFGQVDYNLTDQLVLLAGLRFTDEELDYSFDRVVADGGFFGFVPPLAFAGSTSDDAFSGLLGLQYFIGDHMIYGTWSQGYKGQGVNVNNFVSQFEVDNGLEVVDAEVPTNYEIGARTEWADGRLFIDVTAFLTEFEDYQLSVFDPDTNSSGLRNAANLETKGIEANFSALVTDNLTLNGAITLMDATYDSFPNGPCYPGQGVAGGCDDNDNSGTQNTPDTQDLAGAPLENAPDLSYSFSANYTRPITATGWEFFANGTLLYQDDVQYNVNQDPGAADDSYTRVNAALGFTSPDDRWKVSLFAKNLFDEEYALRVLSAGSDDLGGSNQFLPYDYARVLGLRLDLSL